jgi:hypothetical protein
MLQIQIQPELVLGYKMIGAVMNRWTVPIGVEVSKKGFFWARCRSNSA